MRSLLILISTSLIGCPVDPCYNNNYQNITNYEVSPNRVTPDGIQVDDQNMELDLEEVDRQTRALEECLGVTILCDCLTIKVPPDWYISECSGHQLFPCDIDPEVCMRKGLTAEDLARCPCACRSMIQDETIIVTAPNLLLYRGELARMVTGENNPWINYASCLLD